MAIWRVLGRDSESTLLGSGPDSSLGKVRGWLISLGCFGMIGKRFMFSPFLSICFSRCWYIIAGTHVRPSPSTSHLLPFYRLEHPNINSRIQLRHTRRLHFRHPGLLPWIPAGDIAPSITASDYARFWVDLREEIEVDVGGGGEGEGAKIVKLRDVMCVNGERRSIVRSISGKRTLPSTFFERGGAGKEAGFLPLLLLLLPRKGQWEEIRKELMRERESKIGLLVLDPMWYLRVGQIWESQFRWRLLRRIRPLTWTTGGHKRLLLRHSSPYRISI